MVQPALKECPNCGSDSLKRLIGKGAGIIFKGPGFYATDYRKPEKIRDSESPDKEGKSADGEK
jgi:predicted nucleic acid-binding Zn ribbon protein